MSVRVPCLDGLRGISVCLVLLAHLSGTRELTSGARLPELYGLGNLGVRVFFVISGFLITLLCCTNAPPPVASRCRASFCAVRFASCLPRSCTSG